MDYITVPMEDGLKYPEDGVLEVHHTPTKEYTNGTVVEVGLNMLDTSGDVRSEVPANMIDVVGINTKGVNGKLIVAPAPAQSVLATGFSPSFTLGDCCVHVMGTATYRNKSLRIGFMVAVYRQNGKMEAHLAGSDNVFGTVVDDGGAPVIKGTGRDILRSLAHNAALEYAERHGVAWSVVSRAMARQTARRFVFNELTHLALQVTHKYAAMEAIEATLPTI